MSGGARVPRQAGAFEIGQTPGPAQGDVCSTDPRWPVVVAALAHPERYATPPRAFAGRQEHLEHSATAVLAALGEAFQQQAGTVAQPASCCPDLPGRSA